MVWAPSGWGLAVGAVAGGGAQLLGSVLRCCRSLAPGPDVAAALALIFRARRAYHGAASHRWVAGTAGNASRPSLRGMG